MIVIPVLFKHLVNIKRLSSLGKGWVAVVGLAGATFAGQQLVLTGTLLAYMLITQLLCIFVTNK